MQDLWREIQDWPESSGEEEAVVPWNVKEVLLGTGRAAALGLERWDEALSLNGENVDAKRRAARLLHVARTEYNNYGRLIRLGRYENAQELLYRCLRTFQAEGRSEELGLVYTALADLEDEFGHHAVAAVHAQTALRYSYLDGQPRHCANSHFNLANYLPRSKGDLGLALVHRLACVLIEYQTGHGKLTAWLRALRTDLVEGPEILPASFDELFDRVEQTEGVHFRKLFDRLPRRAASGEEALRRVLEMVREEPEKEAKAQTAE